MENNSTELVFILDRSGSMSGLEKDTIGGFNGMIGKQRKQEGECYVTTFLFDDRTEFLHDRLRLNDVTEITEDQYYVRGCTALIDAIGIALTHIESIHRYVRPEDVPAHTVFIITTDGMENASRQYSYERVRKMIERQKDQYHWEFLFLGANIDAVSVAGRFGIDRSRAVRYEHDAEGTMLNFRVMSKAVSCARQAPSAAGMSDFLDEDELLEPIRKDYAKRHKE